jgi:hypothetical protein
MFKLKNTHKITYSEVGQPNPLRWRIMLRKKDTLHSQSGLIKCKDFFNDVVAWKQGKHRFKIYLFDNKITFNRAGLYFILTGISNREMFLANLDVLNEKIKENLNTKISYYTTARKSKVVIHIPNPLWENTYYISVVSMMIRLCNYNCVYKKWEDFFHADAPMNTAENAFNPKAKALVLTNGFTIPKVAKGCWYYARFGWTSKSDKPVHGTTVHNNGASDWAMALGELE